MLVRLAMPRWVTGTLVVDFVQIIDFPVQMVAPCQQLASSFFCNPIYRSAIVIRTIVVFPALLKYLGLVECKSLPNGNTTQEFAVGYRDDFYKHVSVNDL